MPRLQLFAPGPASQYQSSPAPRPHILLVVDGFPKTLGGGERVVLRLAALLPELGFRISILTFAIHPESALGADNAPCPVYLLPLTKAWNFSALQGAVAFSQFLRREHIAIVQTFFESSDLWAGLITRLTSRAKLIWSRRDMGILRSPKHSKAYRALRRLPHAVSAVSSKVAEHVVREDGVKPSRVHIVHNGIDLATRPAPNPPGRHTHPVHITTVGNIRYVKGHDLLLQAAVRVLDKYPDVHFTIAGAILEPEFHRDLVRAIENSGSAASFQLLGEVRDLPAHLATASLFVLPSRSEGFSNALIEAMAENLPVVATDVGGNAEAVEQGKTGLIVPPEDVEALADALLLFCGDASKRSAYGEAGRRIAEEKFSAAAMVRNTAEIYRKLLGTRD